MRTEELSGQEIRTMAKKGKVATIVKQKTGTIVDNQPIAQQAQKQAEQIKSPKAAESKTDPIIDNIQAASIAEELEHQVNELVLKAFEKTLETKNIATQKFEKTKESVKEAADQLLKNPTIQQFKEHLSERYEENVNRKTFEQIADALNRYEGDFGDLNSDIEKALDENQDESAGSIFTKLYNLGDEKMKTLLNKVKIQTSDSDEIEFTAFTSAESSDDQSNSVGITGLDILESTEGF